AVERPSFVSWPPTAREAGGGSGRGYRRRNAIARRRSVWAGGGREYDAGAPAGYIRHWRVGGSGWRYRLEVSGGRCGGLGGVPRTGAGVTWFSQSSEPASAGTWNPFVF